MNVGLVDLGVVEVDGLESGTSEGGIEVDILIKTLDLGGGLGSRGESVLVILTSGADMTEGTGLEEMSKNVGRLLTT